MLVIRKVEAADHEEVLDLLRTDFYPHEPCAVGLDLCPPGYRSIAGAAVSRLTLLQVPPHPNMALSGRPWCHPVQRTDSWFANRQEQTCLLLMSWDTFGILE